MAGERIDTAIALMLPEYSRSKISACIKAGDMLINERKFKAKEKVNGIEIVHANLKQNEDIGWIAEDIPFAVVFEDDDIIVINKPASLVTHPGAGNWQGTLANGLLFYEPELFKLDRAGIVHRLDKNTSGLMVVARSAKAQKNLAEQLQTHAVSREYSAIVYGHMISGGTIDKPIGRDSRDRVKQAVTESGKEALTHYRVIERFANHTHVKVILETGRMHQIRVHLSHIGYSLIGDLMYGGKIRFPKKAKEDLKDSLKAFNRQALHAKKLTIEHPITGETMSWKAPLPDDMLELLDILREFDAQ